MEHYEYLHRMFPCTRMSKGIVGNFPLEGLTKSWVNTGKAFQIGSSQIGAAPTRIPWYLLVIIFRLIDTINKCWSVAAQMFILETSMKGRLGQEIKKNMEENIQMKSL